MGQTESVALIVAVAAAVLAVLAVAFGIGGYVQGAAGGRRATAARQRAAAAEEVAVQARALAEQALQAVRQVQQRPGSSERPTADAAPEPATGATAEGGPAADPSSAEPVPIAAPPVSEPDSILDTPTRRRSSGPPTGPTHRRSAPSTGPVPRTGSPRTGSGPIVVPVLEPPAAPAQAESAASTDVTDEVPPAPEAAVPAPAAAAEQPEPAAQQPGPAADLPEPSEDPAPAAEPSAGRAGSSGRQLASTNRRPPTMSWDEALRTGAIPLPHRSRGTYAAPERASARPAPKQLPSGLRFEILAVGRQRFDAVNRGEDDVVDAVVDGVGDDAHLVRPMSSRPVPVPPGGALSFSVLRVEGRAASVRISWRSSSGEVAGEVHALA